MPTTDFDTIIKRSIAIRQKYHEIELKHHGSEWKIFLRKMEDML
jgi:hypothetical protein